jgi:hypothetical protein
MNRIRDVLGVDHAAVSPELRQQITDGHAQARRLRGHTVTCAAATRARND